MQLGDFIKSKVFGAKFMTAGVKVTFTDDEILIETEDKHTYSVPYELEEI